MWAKPILLNHSVEAKALKEPPGKGGWGWLWEGDIRTMVTCGETAANPLGLNVIEVSWNCSGSLILVRGAEFYVALLTSNCQSSFKRYYPRATSRFVSFGGLLQNSMTEIPRLYQWKVTRGNVSSVSILAYFCLFSCTHVYDTFLFSWKSTIVTFESLVILTSIKTSNIFK